MQYESYLAAALPPPAARELALLAFALAALLSVLIMDCSAHGVGDPAIWPTTRGRRGTAVGVELGVVAGAAVGAGVPLDAVAGVSSAAAALVTASAAPFHAAAPGSVTAPEADERSLAVLSV